MLAWLKGMFGWREIERDPDDVMLMMLFSSATFGRLAEDR